MKLLGDGIGDKITVKGYLAKQKSPQKEICKRLRQIIRETFPGISEEMNMGVPWYEGRYYLVALKDHVNLGFCIKGLDKKKLDLLEGAGRFMRHIKIRHLDEIDENRIVMLLKAARKRGGQYEK